MISFNIKRFTMLSIKRLAAAITVSLLITFFVSCTTQQKKPINVPEGLQEIEITVRAMTNQLLRQMENDQIKYGDIKDGKLIKTKVVLAPFANADTGDIVTIHDAKTRQGNDSPESRKIVLEFMAEVRENSLACGEERCDGFRCRKDEQIIFSGKHKTCRNKSLMRFKDFSIQKISLENWEQADYIVYGVIEPRASARKTNHYRLYASVVDRQKRKVIAKSKGNIAGEVSIKPMAIYRDIFLYLQPSELRHLNYLTRDIMLGSKIRDHDKLNALFVEAATFYEKNECEQALALYEQAAEYMDGRTSATFAAIGQTHLCLKDEEAARLAMTKAIYYGIDSKELKTKILFESSSSVFPRNEKKRLEYKVWLYQIGKIAHENQYCLEIIGHSGKMGGEAYKRHLARKRAITVQREIWRGWPKVRSVAYGKNDSECIVCTKPDNESNAIDRRVEIKFIQDCEKKTE